ncbi:MAG: nitroreductase family protein [Acidobacteriota bacterium]
MLDRSAPSDHQITDLLARRWSARAFSDRPIDLETLRSLFEAARWAPSSGNGQPWSFLVAGKQDAVEFERLASVLNPGNAWARQAAVLGISVAALDRLPGKPNAHAWHDVGLASQSMALQATAMGLSMHMMGGFSSDKAREIFEIPERWAPVAAFAIGYPGDPSSLPEDLRAKELAPRQRKPIQEFVYQGRWGHPGGLD